MEYDVTQLDGEVIGGNFRLAEAIGRGSMGTIYRAEQLSLGKRVVLKILHTHLMDKALQKERFEQEARAASMLAHPNVIQVIDFGRCASGAPYIAMEYVPGRDLCELLYQDFPIDYVRIIKIATQICCALDEAHANGVLHRDLKPENIMVSNRRNMRDFVKVLDFGIAKLLGMNQVKTMAGMVCGTPEYMSPEQARGETLDGRSDLYALGILLYQLLTRRLPFTGPTPIATVTKQLEEAPIKPSQHVPDIPDELEALVMALLEKDREARPQSALEVAGELERVGERVEQMRLSSEHRLLGPRSGLGFDGPATRPSEREGDASSPPAYALQQDLSVLVSPEDAPKPPLAPGAFRKSTVTIILQPGQMWLLLGIFSLLITIILALAWKLL